VLLYLGAVFVGGDLLDIASIGRLALTEDQSWSAPPDSSVRRPSTPPGRRHPSPSSSRSASGGRWWPAGRSTASVAIG
jgi:hypothetical protein